MAYWTPQLIACADCAEPVLAAAPTVIRCKPCQALAVKRIAKRANEKRTAKVRAERQIATLNR